MDYIPFNSRNEVHKKPFGAIENDSSVRLKVVLPRSLCCTGVNLAIKKDACETVLVPMEWDSMEGENEEWWSIDYTIHDTGLYFYHFEFETAFGTNKIFHDGSCLGSLNGGEFDWQLTVYDKNFATPEWLKGGLIYQIFPDRFFNSGKAKANVPSDRILREDWGGEPGWRPDENGKVLNNDFFGGDLDGVKEKLPYLKELGVSCIYFNPIFESQSNHRYDTSDYNKIDSILGNEEDLKSLCKEAEKYGISIILDGVFSHTGVDSIYFNKYGRYDNEGAYQSKNSPYYKWYKFKNWPNDYHSWWGFETLPEVQEETKEYIDFITGKDGILKKWLKVGVKGWRLDVADELPDVFLDEVRKSIKDENPEAFLLGEVWEDASTKFAYGDRRRYLQGQQLDSVMNYPFADAIIEFVRTGIVEGFSNKICSILENYPKCVVDVLMNHIGTHDTARAITQLVGESSEYRDREWQSKKHLSKEQYEKGVQLLKLASLIQYTLPGVPSLYYGDEAGMQGYKDPFNRGCYPWGRENKELISWYKTLGKLRSECKSLKDGRYYLVSEMLSCLCFVRSNDEEEIMVIINRNEHSIEYTIPFDWEFSRTVLGRKYGRSVKLNALEGAVLKRKKVR